MNTQQRTCRQCVDTPGFHAGLHAGHIWTDVTCPAYRTLAGEDCTWYAGEQIAGWRPYAELVR